MLLGEVCEEEDLEGGAGVGRGGEDEEEEGAKEEEDAAAGVGEVCGAAEGFDLNFDLLSAEFTSLSRESLIRISGNFRDVACRSVVTKSAISSLRSCLVSVIVVSCWGAGAVERE